MDSSFLSIFGLKSIIVIAVVLLILLKKKNLSFKREVYKYKPISIMTENEVKLFRRLVEGFPNFYIFPQVSMGAVLKPQSKEGEKGYLVAFRAISQKRIDYVICNRALNIMCLLELDDSTHSPARDNARDQITGMAGLKTIRVRTGSVVDLAPLHRWVDEKRPNMPPINESSTFS